jgi:hypothetical protein
MNFKNLLLFIITVLLLYSCSPQKRLHKLVTKHPELTRIDTIKIQDSVFVPGIKADTVFHFSVLKDTIIITKEKLQIQLIEINDTIYLNAKVEPDTIIITKEIPIQRILHIEPEKWYITIWNKFKFWLFYILSFIVLLIVLFKRL